MKTFRLKDLTVTLDISREAEAKPFCLNYPPLCINYTPIGCHGFTPVCVGGTCAFHTFNCGPCTYITPIDCRLNTRPECIGVTLLDCGLTDFRDTTILERVIPELNENELTEMRRTLEGLITRIDENAQANVGDLDQLENKLSDAINEVRGQKASAKKS